MQAKTSLVTLEDLEFLPYLEDGAIAEHLSKKIGVYAIYDEAKELMFVGYSRDVYSSLKQHLVRHPQSCFWFKLQTIHRPSRAVLEATKQAWLAEQGIPYGNREEDTSWTQAIDTKQMMSEAEKAQYEAASDGLQQTKILKQVARRVQAQIEAQLQQRNLTTEIRFNPKLKERGLLDLK